jgi:hypothetical protein
MCVYRTNVSMYVPSNNTMYKHERYIRVCVYHMYGSMYVPSNTTEHMHIVMCVCVCMRVHIYIYVCVSYHMYGSSMYIVTRLSTYIKRYMCEHASVTR